MTDAPPGPSAILEVEGLYKTFRVRRGVDLVAVNSVSFTLSRGSSLAIVGESGAGKTTIARILVGLERQTRGVVYVNGHERAATRIRSAERLRRAREVQIVFQDPYLSLDPRQRVGDCIAEMLRMHYGQSKQERAARVGELLDQVGLDPRRAASRPRVLSGGERQRVAIARALAVRPQVLILDEAVSALDVSVQAQVLNLLTDIRRETGTSYLLISHDLAVVRQLADEVLVMRRGSVVEAGSTPEVLKAPRHPYTRLLRASVPRPGWTPRAAARLSDQLEESELAQSPGYQLPAP